MTTVQRGCCSKKAINWLRCSLRLSCTLPSASTPCRWKTDLIVCSQSTKRLAFALWSNGDCVTDLNVFVGENDAVDKQFQQLPLAAEIRLLQPPPYALAER